MEPCDHTSVGVVLADRKTNDLLMIKRARPPVGIAPVAGHGIGIQQAIVELGEEVGLADPGLRLSMAGHRPNVCRRPPTHPTHDGHYWEIYTSWVDATKMDLTPAEDEVAAVRWYRHHEVQMLADRTIGYAIQREAGVLDQAAERAWQKNPGLEPVWVRWLAEMGHINALEFAKKSCDWLSTQPSVTQL